MIEERWDSSFVNLWILIWTFNEEIPISGIDRFLFKINRGGNKEREEELILFEETSTNVHIE